MPITNDKKHAAYLAVITRILEGEGKSTREQRRAAFDNSGFDGPLSTLINKVVLQPAKISDEDIDLVKDSGLSENQIFELVICAAAGQAARQYEQALNALSEAVNKSKID